MWSLTWPWKRKLPEATIQNLTYSVITYEIFKKVFGITINNNRRLRKLQGLEPEGEQWELLIDFASYFMTHLLPNDPQVDRVNELYAVVLKGEEEMDFDTAALAASVLGYYLFPLEQGENDQEYYVRVVELVTHWRSQRGAVN